MFAVVHYIVHYSMLGIIKYCTRYYAILYPEMQCRTRGCDAVPRDAMQYPGMQCRTQGCNAVRGDAMPYNFGHVCNAEVDALN